MAFCNIWPHNDGITNFYRLARIHLIAKTPWRVWALFENSSTSIVSSLAFMTQVTIDKNYHDRENIAETSILPIENISSIFRIRQRCYRRYYCWMLNTSRCVWIINALLKRGAHSLQRIWNNTWEVLVFVQYFFHMCFLRNLMCELTSNVMCEQVQRFWDFICVCFSLLPHFRSFRTSARQ